MQVLDHYSFLQFATRSCVDAGESMLLFFDEVAEGGL